MTKPRNPLRAPIEAHLRPAVRPGQVDRMWKDLRERRTASRIRQGRRFRTPAMAAGAGLMAAAAAFWLWVQLPADGTPQALTLVQRSASGEAAARLSSASAEASGVPNTLTAEASPSRFDFSDGSSLELAPGTETEVLANTGRRFVTLLRRGRATFDIKPHGPRRWVVEAGLATVEVLGTKFSVTRRGDSITVSVERGRVLVRGENVPDRAARLTAGHSLEVRRPKEAAPTAAEPPLAAEGSSGEGRQERGGQEHGQREDGQQEHGRRGPYAAAREAPAPTPRPAQARRAGARPAGAQRTEGRSSSVWRARAASGRFAGAYAALGGGPGVERLARRSESVDDCLLLADIARSAGHPEHALVPLRRALKLAPSGPRAQMAAFTLGRVLFLRLGRAREAARYFDRASGERAGVLSEDALAWAAIAYGRGGSPAEAAARARAYRARYPEGRRLPELAQWLRTP